MLRDVFSSSHYEIVSMKDMVSPTDIFFNIKVKKKKPVMLKTDIDDAGNFQTHANTDKINLRRRKVLLLHEMILCFSENNTKRNDSRSRKYEESMSATPKEHLQQVNDTQVGKAQKCHLLYS